MATYFWVNTSSTSTSWDTASNWSTSSGGAPGAVTPTSADDVVFDNNSGRLTLSQTVTTTASSVCKDFAITSRTRGDLSFQPSPYLSIHGSISFSATAKASFSVSTQYLWLLGAGTNTISSGINIPKLLVGGTGTWTQASALIINTLSVPRDVEISSGSYRTNGFTLTANGLLSSSGANPRTIDLSSSLITLSGQTALNLSAVNLTYVDNGSTSIVVTGTSTASVVSVSSGVALNSLTASRATISSGGIIFAGGTFGALTLNATATGSTQFILSSTVTVTGTLTCSGAASTSRGFVLSSLVRQARTLSAGTTSITDFDFQDITAAGTAAWTGTRVGDAKGNSGITFSTPKTVYWSNAGSANWSGVAWATSSGGTPAASNFPLPQDTAIYDDAGLASGAVVTVDKPWNMPTIIATAVTGAKPFTFACGSGFGSSFLNFYGGFELNTNATRLISGTPFWYFLGRVTQNLAQPYPGAPSGVMPSAVVRDTSTLNLTGNILVNSVSVEANSTFTANTFNVTAEGFVLNERGVCNMGTGTLWTISSYWNVTTASPGVTLINAETSTISMSGSSAATFNGGGKTYATLYFDISVIGGLIINNSNTFGTISGSTGTNRRVIFQAGSTTTVTNFNLNGIAGVGGQLGLVSTSSGSSYTISKSSGVVSVEYLNISDSNATGGATFLAINSINSGGNTGWVFGIPNTGFLLFC